VICYHVKEKNGRKGGKYSKTTVLKRGCKKIGGKIRVARITDVDKIGGEV